MTADDYIAKLMKRGFKSLGKGIFSTVLAKPGSNRVIKVVRCSDDAWPAYAEWCFDNPQPFAPVIHSMKWHLDENGERSFCVAVLDRLAATWRERHKLLDRMRPDYDKLAFRFAIYDRALGYGGGWQERIDIADRHSMPELANYLRKLYAVFGDLSPDMHDGNWMVTEDGELFLTDPFCGTHSSSRNRLKRQRQLELALAARLNPSVFSGRCR
jgi:hypothetical protein